MPNRKSKEKSTVGKILRGAVAGVGLWAAAGSSQAASSTETTPIREADTSSVSAENTTLSTLSPEAEAYLEPFLKNRDWAVSLWKERGQVPRAWSNLDEKHLQALVAYISSVDGEMYVPSMLANLGLVPTDLTKLIQDGVREMVIASGYSLSPNDPQYIGNKRLRELKAERIHADLARLDQ